MKYTISIICTFLFALIAMAQQQTKAENSHDTAKQKSITFIAGNSIHLWGDHENKAICEFYRQMINEARPDIKTSIVYIEKGEKLDMNNLPDAIIIIGEGEANHPFKDNPQILQELSAKKVNIGIFHYSLHFSKSKDYINLDKTVGGHYEPYWSTNPSWKADFKLAKHPINNGVKEFTIDDEFYFNIRFYNKKGVKLTHIAQAAPNDRLRLRQFGEHTGNAYIRANKGKKETLLWTCENENGTRGFGFGGGHSIWIFGDNNFRKMMLNVAMWLAKEEIPEKGYESSAPDFDKIAKTFDKPERSDRSDYEKMWKQFIAERSQKSE